MSESHSNGSESHRIKLLKSDNWMPWKWRMLAILWDQGLKKYVEKTAESPKLRRPEEPTIEETEAIDKWKEGDAKAHIRIELSIRDSEMIHLSSTVMACDMWNQLSLVKESWGCLEPVQPQFLVASSWKFQQCENGNFVGAWIELKLKWVSPTITIRSTVFVTQC